MPLRFAYYLAGYYEEAIATLEPIAGSGSDFGIYTILAAANAELGRTKEAQEAAKEVQRLWPFFNANNFVEHWRDAKSRRRIADGLAKAGLQ